MRFKGNETDDSALPKLLRGMALQIFSMWSRRKSKALSLPTILSEMSIHILSLRSRRQHRAWGGASAEPKEYGVFAHQAREAGGSFLSCAISSSLRLGQTGRDYLFRLLTDRAKLHGLPTDVVKIVQ